MSLELLESYDFAADNSMAPCTLLYSNLLRNISSITFVHSFTNFSLTGKEKNFMVVFLIKLGYRHKGLKLLQHCAVVNAQTVLVCSARAG